MNALSDNPSDQELMNILEMCETLIPQYVAQKRMTNIKAQAILRKVKEFKVLCNVTLDNPVLQAMKVSKMKEIIREFKSAFMSNVTV